MSEHGRTFRMGVFNAIDVLLETSREYPGVPLDKLVTALLNGRATTAGFDYPAAIDLVERVPALLAVRRDGRCMRLRAYLCLLLAEIQPGWRYLLTGGRELVAQHLDADVLQVFRSSGLYDPASDEDVRQWWDQMASNMRLVQDEARLVSYHLKTGHWLSNQNRPGLNWVVYLTSVRFRKLPHPRLRAVSGFGFAGGSFCR